MFIITQISKPQSSADQTPKFTLAAAYCLHCHLSMFCRVNQHQFIAKRHLKLMEIHLVGGFNHLEKYESQWEGLSFIIMENNPNV
jgi:hypothetical protein